MTTAILAEQLNALSAQVALLASEREEQQNKQPVPPLPTRPQAFVDPATGRGDLGPAVAQRKMPPLSQGLATPARTTPAKALQLLGPPPKTRMSPLSMASPVLADEPRDPLRAPPDPTEQALAQQSAALTALVSHLIQGNDPFGLDPSSSSGVPSSSTKGTQKREQLQQALAVGQSNFFMMLQQQLCRRLQPSNTVPKTEEELNARAPSLLTYLERYGGFKGQKEAGLLMWVIGHAVDAAAWGDFHATREFLALAVMGLEQSAFDAGNWDLAFVLTLTGDPPTALFQDRMTSMTSSASPFSPLIPSQLASISLAYLKEIDLLQNRRQEKRVKKGQQQKEEEGSPSPRRKPKFPKRPKAIADGQA